MLAFARSKLSYANVAATLALVLALTGGVVYAADKIGSKDIAKNAVKSKHLKNGQVRAADLARGAVTSAGVADGSLTGEDLAAGAMPAGPRGEQGPPGPQGPAGTQGPAGAPGVSGYEVVQRISPASSDDKTFRVNCPGSKRVVGGGTTIVDEFEKIAIDQNDLLSSQGWIGSAHEHEPTSAEWRLQVTAVCVSVGS